METVSRQMPHLARFKTPVLMFVAAGSLQSLLSATGEELGWRGFLVPALAFRA